MLIKLNQSENRNNNSNHLKDLLQTITSCTLYVLITLISFTEYLINKDYIDKLFKSLFFFEKLTQIHRNNQHSNLHPVPPTTNRPVTIGTSPVATDLFLFHKNSFSESNLTQNAGFSLNIHYSYPQNRSYVLLQDCSQPQIVLTCYGGTVHQPRIVLARFDQD